MRQTLSAPALLTAAQTNLLREIVDARPDAFATDRLTHSGRRALIALFEQGLVVPRPQGSLVASTLAGRQLLAGGEGAISRDAAQFGADAVSR